MWTEQKWNLFHFANGDLKKYLVILFFPVSSVTKRIAQLDFFLEMFPRNELNLIVKLTNVEVRKKIQGKQYGKL